MSGTEWEHSLGRGGFGLTGGLFFFVFGLQS